MNLDSKILRQDRNIDLISSNNRVEIDKKALLSTLWIFVLLNMIFRDIHEFFRLGLLEEMMTGVVNGNQELKVEDCTYDAVLGLSILHLLENKERAIVKVYQMLKPGGLFITSTTCMGDAYSWFKLIAPIGKALGFFPLVRVFTAKHLLESLTDAGFEIEYRWQPSKDKAIFIVAKKLGKSI